jgi:hypothetical protein
MVTLMHLLAVIGTFIGSLLIAVRISDNQIVIKLIIFVLMTAAWKYTEIIKRDK